MALPQSLIFVGNDLAGPGIVAILQPTVPVWASIIAICLKDEKNAWLKWLGLFLSIAGAVVLAEVWELSTKPTVAWGVLIMIVQSSSYAIFIVLMSRFLIRGLSGGSYPFSTFLLVVSLGLVLITSVSVPSFISIDWDTIPPLVWGAVLWAGIMTSFVAHCGNVWAMRHVPPTTTAMYTTLQPVITVLLAWAVLGEPLTWPDGVGFVLVAMGLACVLYQVLTRTPVTLALTLTLVTLTLTPCHPDPQKEKERKARVERALVASRSMQALVEEAEKIAQATAAAEP